MQWLSVLFIVQTHLSMFIRRFPLVLHIHHLLNLLEINIHLMNPLSGWQNCTYFKLHKSVMKREILLLPYHNSHAVWPTILSWIQKRNILFNYYASYAFLSSKYKISHIIFHFVIDHGWDRNSTPGLGKGNQVYFYSLL